MEACKKNAFKSKDRITVRLGCKKCDRAMKSKRFWKKLNAWTK